MGKNRKGWPSRTLPPSQGIRAPGAEEDSRKSPSGAGGLAEAAGRVPGEAPGEGSTHIPAPWPPAQPGPCGAGKPGMKPTRSAKHRVTNRGVHCLRTTQARASVRPCYVSLQSAVFCLDVRPRDCAAGLLVPRARSAQRSVVAMSPCGVWPVTSHWGGCPHSLVGAPGVSPAPPDYGWGCDECLCVCPVVASVVWTARPQGKTLSLGRFA